VKYLQFALVAALAASTSLSSFADTGKKSTGIGHMEGRRDLNMIQVEPTIINEAYYSSGQAERHQYVGNVLPAGAPIPDIDEPLSKQKVNHPPVTNAAPTAGNATTAASAPKTASKKQKADMFDRHTFVGKTLPPGAAIPDNE
jgi:hypothetical protein